MTGLESRILPEQQRETLLHWTNKPEFQLLLAIVRNRIAVAVEEQVRITLTNADQILREGAGNPGFDKSARDVARWQIVHESLLELQAQIADSGKSVLVGNKLEV